MICTGKGKNIVKQQTLRDCVRVAWVIVKIGHHWKTELTELIWISMLAKNELLLAACLRCEISVWKNFWRNVCTTGWKANHVSVLFPSFDSFQIGFVLFLLNLLKEARRDQRRPWEHHDAISVWRFCCFWIFGFLDLFFRILVVNGRDGNDLGSDRKSVV